ncbi:MAG: hypothetical protein ABJK39_04250 [Hyphomicrobiales bacterium]
MYFLKFCKLAGAGIIAATIGVGFSAPVHARTVLKPNPSAVHVFGSELSVVRFQQGEFRNIGNGRWHEISAATNQTTFQFLAQSTTANHVTLFDSTRNVTLVLDINLGQILFAVGTPNFRPLYNITTFEFVRHLPAGQPATATRPIAPPAPSNPQVYTPGGNTGGNAGGTVGGGVVTAPPVDPRRWQHFTSRSQGRRVHSLDYGIPESDALTFRASCVRGSGAARFIISTNVGNQQNGAGVNINFRTNGFAKNYTGRVAGAGNTQEGIAGIRVVAGVNDPIWRTLARKNRISYSALGQRQTLSLSGSSAAVNAFLRGCRPKAVVQPPVVQPPVVPQNPGNTPRPPSTQTRGGEISCNRFGRIKSRNSNRRTNITFVNRSGRKRTVMWIDYQGAPKQYGVVQPGRSRTFSTFISHPWMTVNGPGDCRQLFLPRPRGSTYVISR